MSLAAAALTCSKDRKLDRHSDWIKNIETLSSHLIVFVMDRKAASPSTECQASESFRVLGLDWSGVQSRNSAHRQRFPVMRLDDWDSLCPALDFLTFHAILDSVSYVGVTVTVTEADSGSHLVA